ncbi:MAG: DUF4136 domain-containing protein [Chitinophagaceae bacterium]
MKRGLLFTGVATIILLAGCGPTSQVEVAKGVNFHNYKTFGWINDNGVTKAGRVNNDIVDNNIKNSIGVELEKKGWQEVDQNPDVLLDYNVMVEKGVRQETEPVYPYPYSGYYYNWRRRRLGYFYNPYYFGAYQTYNVPFKEGTLTVNMIDAKTNKLIWQGWAKGDITNQTVSSKEAQADVNAIFKKLNLPQE